MSHSSPTTQPQPQPQPQEPTSATNQSTPNTPQSTIPSSIPKKTPPLPWSHLETVNLIEAYQEKWYSLKRGQLKASQWEEVAVSVAARCGFKELSKSATQCRHKMEKLRKRYRGEKQRPSPYVWTYFEMMDMMERGPFPISAARPISLLPPKNLSSSHQSHQHRPIYNHPPVSQSSEEEDEEEEENDDDEINKSRSINHILRRSPVASPIFDALPLPRKYSGSGGEARGGGEGQGISRFLRTPMFRKRKRSFGYTEEEEDEEEEEEEGGGGGGGGDGDGRLLSELASVVRAFGEGFVRVENMKLEMMKETEKHRLEMEKKRMEMIHESQRRIVDAVAKTFDSYEKSKKTQET